MSLSRTDAIGLELRDESLNCARLRKEQSIVLPPKCLLQAVSGKTLSVSLEAMPSPVRIPDLWIQL